MSQLWNRMLVYLARLGAPGAVRKTAIVLLLSIAAFVTVLGFWGWSIHETDQPGIELDFATRLYRTYTLFTAEDGSLLKVPWQLDVARFVAPIVLVGFGALAFFNLASEKVQRFGVRHAKGHTIYIGQPARLDRVSKLYGLSELHRDEPKRSVAVYAVPAAALAASACLRVAVDLDEDEWPAETSAEHAGEIVVAVNDDDRAVALATLAAEKFRYARLVVDVGSADTMRWLGLWMMTRHPAQDIRVISIDQADSRVQAGTSESKCDEAVVVAGVDSGASRIVTEVLDQMRGQAVHSGSSVRPLLFIIDDHDRGLRSDANDAVIVEAGSEQRAIDACAGRSTRVLALGRSGMKAAMRVAAAVPRSEFVRLDADGFDGEQLRAEVERGDLEPTLAGLVFGPLRLLSTSAAGIQRTSSVSQVHLREQELIFAERVSKLWMAGWSISVSAAPLPYQPNNVLERMSHDLGLAGEPDFPLARALVSGLCEAGYAITAPPTSTAADSGAPRTASETV